ncbi:MAG: hypothetical protein LBS50_10925 [Prevotellaceae bacterium]|jgi:hypothetical protein|nr:hypothetical protein [Prevotellaceae bacterium]
MYFESCYTADQCKQHYRELAKELHPDKQGGSNAAFTAMQAEYEARLNELAAQAKREHNKIEFEKLAQAAVELAKIVTPEKYAMFQSAMQSPAVAAITTLLNGYFPKQAKTVDNILKLLQ